MVLCVLFKDLLGLWVIWSGCGVVLRHLGDFSFRILINDAGLPLYLWFGV